MNSICLKKSSKRSSPSQAARVIAITDTGTTAAAGAITAATAAALAEEDITIVMGAVTATNAGATAAVNRKKSSCSALGQGFFYVTD
ncbi:hypothetical protein [Bacillus halotolerans]|uniref:hypothetical protein n=1 Tax=Bacillus halotolerans TaxID=260554 RepID=UPI0007505B0B|nr:hypothetical protein [Bacillus halotolerans]KUP37926.1 hypothetical protein AU385_02395 [Bacillus halotolerans]MDL5612450.1 hypothetical protein [Bacillus halotolerans]UYO32292.1 hypothetical protein NDR85_01220 [Bacillus halotolerans]WIG47217.1 hypothetical protein QPL78_01225 [Bacillus halotolerans]